MNLKFLETKLMSIRTWFTFAFVATLLLVSFPPAEAFLFTFTIGSTPAQVSTVMASNPATGTVTSGTITFTVNFNSAVIVTGTPQLNLATTTVASHATYQSGSGSTALVFLYTVTANAAETPVTTTGSAICTTGCSATITNGGTASNLTGANFQTFTGLILAPSVTQSPNGFVVAAPSNTPIIDSTNVQWTTTVTGCGGSTPPCIAANGTVVGGSSLLQMAYVNGVVWQENTADNWYAINYAGSVFNTLAGPQTQSPLTSANDTVVSTVATVVASPGISAPAIIDSAWNVWTLSTTTGGLCTAANCIAANGTNITSGSVTELAYVAGTVWQENTSGQWYNIAYSGGAWVCTLVNCGTTTSPLPSASASAISVVGPALTDSVVNAWTLTSTGCSGATPCAAVGPVGGTAVAITASANVLKLCYVSGTIWKLQGSDWYAVTSVNGASTTFGSGTPTAPASGCTSSFNSQVAYGPSYFLCIGAGGNQSNLSGGGNGGSPSGCSGTGGPGDALYDAAWDGLTTMMGRAPSIIGTPHEGYFADGSENMWTQAATYIISVGQNPIISDTRTNPASGVIPSISWPLGCDSSTAQGNAQAAACINAGPNDNAYPTTGCPNFGSNTSCSFYPNIAAGNDDCRIENVLQQFNNAGGASGLTAGAPGSAGYHNVILRPAWELNGNWYGFQLTDNNLANYKLAWNHFYTVAHNFAAGTSTVRCSGSTVDGGGGSGYGVIPITTVTSGGTIYQANPPMTIEVDWCPNQGNMENDASTPLNTWAPNPAYIDTYSIDFYSGYQPNCIDGGTPTCQGSNESGGTVGTIYVPTTQIALAKANGKSIAGGEIGGLNGPWVQNYVSLLATAGVPISHWNMWDSDVALYPQDGVASWSIPGDANCQTNTGTPLVGSAPGGTVNSNASCGVTSYTASPTAGSVAAYWVQGFGASGTVTGNQ